MLGDSRYPTWAKSKGMKLEEDSGGKYFNFGFYVEFKLYILPILRFEFTKGYAQPPRGYVKPGQASALNKKNKEKAKKDKLKKKVKSEDW